MVRSIIALGMASFVSAVPFKSAHFPSTSLSTGFHFVVNITHPETSAADGSFGGWKLQGIHTGAGFNDAVLTNSNGRVFYHNGTDTDVRLDNGSILTDGGTPLFPMGIYIQAKDKSDPLYKSEHDVGINVGSGTIGVSLAPSSEPYSYLKAKLPGTFVACQRTVPYYNAQFIVVRYSYSVYNPTTASYAPALPEACTPITLIPECDGLAELPEGSISNHEFARQSRCYENVSAIDWSKFAPVPALVS
ncbi:hypothetical protein GGS21DRAFT_487586 [Xylaria nigripes]|nr:hypothetical protein GGS21DRAFT_487586 [Xylaria nigripes]